jgi:lysozyme
MDTNKPLRLSPRGLALLKSPGFETGPDGRHFAAVPYRCAANKPTIGFGHVIRPNESFPHPITEEVAESLLAQDVGSAEIFVSATTRIATQAQFDALVILVFNIGVGAFDKSTLRRLINAGDTAEAIAHEWMRWVNAGGKRCDGLVIRRTCELMMYQGSDDAAITAERERLAVLARKGNL